VAVPPEPAPGHPEIVRVRADNPSAMTLDGTNTYIVGSVGGRGPVFVIDPGPADPAHIAAVAAVCDERGELAGTLLTHSHGDHSEGVELLGAPLLGPSRAQEAGLEALATPGHSPDHFCFLRGAVCFSGDLVLGQGSTIVPPDGGSLVAYLDSLAKLQRLELELICPGHGPWVTDPKAKLKEYVEHRLDRERKLVAAVDGGERSKEALLDAAWDDVPAELRPAAAMAMEAHLQKLAAEGRLPADLRD
jgi:glyoxylase-like metal-dependent hydrolase (beta-lactamase superfamily II)